jgi:hypothetical protein
MKKKPHTIDQLLLRTLRAVMLVAIALTIGAHIDATIAASCEFTFLGT